MKKSSRCPKCEGADILFVPGTTGAYGTGNNIMTGATIFSAIPVDRYVCMTCGYTEEWIRTEDLAKLRKKYDGRKS